EDGVRVPLEGEEFSSSVHVPHLHRSIIAATDNTFSVWREDDAMDRAPMSQEGESFDTLLGVPQSHSPIIAGTRETFAVWAEGHAEDRVRVAPEGKLLLA